MTKAFKLYALKFLTLIVPNIFYIFKEISLTSINRLKVDIEHGQRVYTLNVVFLCRRRQRERWRPHHHLPRVLRLQRSARGRLPQCGYLPDQHPQVHVIQL